MMDGVRPECDALDLFWQDLAKTLNAIPDTALEISYAKPGTSQFNKAHYLREVAAVDLRNFSQCRSNVSFLSSCTGVEFTEPMSHLTKRQTSDKSIRQKCIVSLDLDFKDTNSDFPLLTPIEKRDRAIQFFLPLKEKAEAAKLPLWIADFSGNGIHFHFRLVTPLETLDSKAYKAFYEKLSDAVTMLFGDQVKFDTSCCNVARLMRLPLSTNWKDASNPVPGLLLFHNSQADASEFVKPFFELSSGVKDKPHAKKTKLNEILDLKSVFEHFKYSKLVTLTRKGETSVCSSPFTEDKTPSFYFDHKKKMFFDFSANKGGDLLSLIASLAHLDCRAEFSKVIEIAKEICGTSGEESESRYSLRNDGVWYSNPLNEEEARVWICSFLEVLAYTRNSSGGSWGRLLAFKDKDGQTKKWAMPMELLAGDGLEIRRELLRQGLEITTSKTGRSHLLSFLQSSTSTKRARCVNRIGWQDGLFVLPDAVFGGKAQQEEIVLQVTGDFRAFCIQGTLEEWKVKVARPCRGNSRLLFVLALAFAPPLLALSEDESAGVHLVGPSSIGKTLALRIAGSVWGGGGVNGYLQKWRATVNGLENLAESRCDTLLVLDELAEIDAKDAGQAVYMLANGTGKKRLSKDAVPEPVAEWRTLFLSSGEITLGTYLKENDGVQRGGQSVRLIDVDADAGKGMGIFESLNGFQSPSELADALRAAALACYGSPIRAFLRALVAQVDLLKTIQCYRNHFLGRFQDFNLPGQARRVANRFSLAAAAGSLASDFGVLPYSREEIQDSIAVIFSDWIQSRPASADFETDQILSQIRSFIQQNGCSQFPELVNQPANSFTGKCAGFRKRNEKGEVEWLIFNEVFRREVCKGFDLRSVIKLLKRENLLKIGIGGTASVPTRLPHFGLVRVYHLRSSILENLESSKVTESVLRSVTP